MDPLLGGQLRQQAVWVDEAVCIGCRYCAHVASNTFVVEQDWGRSRVMRQDGDSTERIQEAIDTCPVDCIHWVAYEQLPQLQEQLQELLQLQLQPPFQYPLQPPLQRQLQQLLSHLQPHLLQVEPLF
jgi:ferredoxin